ncbi:MFS transporter [Desulfovibrio sp. OttesenSCG-928-I05]|nr:MFS transporter [Desulfovibrio sp. OttesenSCG-928-I05]
MSDPVHSAPDRDNGSFYRSLLPVLFVSLVFFSNYTDRAILGPLLVHMEKDLGIDHVTSTSLLLFLSSGFCVGILFSGFATALIKPGRVISFSAMGCGATLLFLSRLTTIGEARILFAILGLFGGFYLTAAMATLRSLVRPEDWSRAIAVHELAPALSFILSPLIAETAYAFWGWQGAMQGMGMVSLAIGGSFLLFGKGGSETTDKPSLSGVIAGLRNPVLWVFMWMFALAVGGEFAPYSVLPLSLTAEQGFDSAEASRLLSLSRLACPFGVLFGGWAAMRLGAKRTIASFLLVHGLSLAALSLPVSLVGKSGLFLAMTAQGAASAFVFPALFTLFARSFPYGQQAMLLAIAVPAATYLGTGCAPFLLGTAGEYWGFSYGYLAFGIICLATLPVLLVSERNVNNDTA